MRILHYQHNGVGVVLSDALNQLPGVKSKVITTLIHPFGFHANWTLPPFPFIAHFLLATILHKHFDVLHSHDNFPLPEYVIKKWSGRIVQHYHNPLSGDFYPNLQIPAIVSTPSTLATIPNSVWVPLPVDLTKFYPLHGRLYNPNNLIIGFSYNVNADKNKLKYIPYHELIVFSSTHNTITLRKLDRNLFYTDMPNYYKSLDIYVDRIGLNSYGWQAIEAAACGVIIITQSISHPDDCPFSYATRGTLSNVLESIITLPKPIFLNMRKQSTDYARKHHDVSLLTKRYIQIYSNLEDVNAFTTSLGDAWS